MNDLLQRAVLALIVSLALVTGSAWALPDGAVNVNTAPAQELAAALDGVGAARAQAIVDYREQFGQFEAAEDLLAVRGIGQHVIETNREKIHFSD